MAQFAAYSSGRKRLCISFFVWAIFVCYTRIYLGVHYPGDLLVGAAIGSLSGLVAYRISEGIGQLLYRRWLQPRHEAVSIAFSSTLPTLTLSNTTIIIGACVATLTVLLIMSLMSYSL